MTETAGIRAEGLEVRYGRFLALKDVSFVFEGKSLGVLGPNGAGKSTLIKTLLGLIRPTDGRASVLGFDCRNEHLSLRRRVGYVPERDCHVPGMSAVDYVTLGAELAGMPRVDAIYRAHEMLHFCGLGEARYREVDGYSAGMKQRIKLAQALVHDPGLLFLDEPTNGLDPEGRTVLLGILRDLAREKNIRIVLSSHLLRDVEFVCEEVLMVREGTVLNHGSVNEFKRVSERNWFARLRGDLGGFVDDAVAAGCLVESQGKEGLAIETPEGEGSEMILRLAAARSCQVRHLARKEMTLEEVFLRTIGEGLD